MAILVNMGQRGFVLKEGFLAPGSQIEVAAETAEKLSKMYGKELKLIVTETKVEPKEEPKEEKPVKRGRPKKVQEEVQTK